MLNARVDTETTSVAVAGNLLVGNVVESCSAWFQLLDIACIGERAAMQAHAVCYGRSYGLQT